MKLEEEIIQPKFDNDYHKAAVNIFYTSNWLAGLHADAFKPYNVTLQQFNILRILRGKYPDTVNLKSVKERMLDKMSDVSRLVERLREKGLIDRKTCTSDRRHIDICITEEGLKLLNELDEDIKRINMRFTTLNEREVETLNELLDKLRG
jgi:DNA-binding MarR family transcriptional regulator